MADVEAGAGQGQHGAAADAGATAGDEGFLAWGHGVAPFKD